MNRLRVGLVGAGGISHAHAPAWAALGADLSIFSLANAETVAALYGGEVVDSLEQLLERVDIVDVCTPTPNHPATVRAALQAGKDVVCEKPLTRHADDARELIALAEHTGRRLYPAHVVRYFQEYAAAKAAIDAGRLGEPAVLRFTRTGTFPDAPWFADEAASGGIVMDQMIHDLDQAVWMAGPAASVYTTRSRGDGSSRIQVANVTLTHAGGAISHCRGVWGASGTQFRYTFHVAGTGGVLRFDSEESPGFTLDAVASAHAAAGDGFLPSTQFVESPYLLEIREFAQALAGGPSPRVSARDGLCAVELSAAALESLRTGAAVDVSALGAPITEEEI